MKHSRKSRVAAKYVAITDQNGPESGTEKLLRAVIQPLPWVPAVVVIRKVS